MPTRILRTLLTLGLEERILNIASSLSVLFVLLPWMSGQLLGGDSITYSGLQSYTSFLGIAVLLLHLGIILITAVPLIRGIGIVPRKHRDMIRLCMTSQATILTIAALSVLTRFTYEFSGLDIRFGIYFCIIASSVATLYAFLIWQEARRHETQDVFHHPEDRVAAPPKPEPMMPSPPPPPPPPPLEPEEHNLRT